jgi:hypothetical protein
MLRRAALVAAALTALFPSSLLGAPPRRAPPVYATPQYGLTFRSPRGATYCRLPRDWVGSDHGTILFLERPGSCADAGYPSSSRGYSPENLALIGLYYGYVTDDSPPPPCRAVGRLSLLGRMRPLCRDQIQGLIRLRVSTTYVSDRHMTRSGVPSEAVLTLVTRNSRLARDLVTFRRLAASLRTCSSLWASDNGRPPFTVGVGPRCPADATWF